MPSKCCSCQSIWWSKACNVKAVYSYLKNIQYFMFTRSSWNWSVISLRHWIFELSQWRGVSIARIYWHLCPWPNLCLRAALMEMANMTWPVIIFWLSMGTSESLASWMVIQQALFPVEKSVFLCGSEVLCSYVGLDALEVIFSRAGVIQFQGLVWISFKTISI